MAQPLTWGGLIGEEMEDELSDGADRRIFEERRVQRRAGSNQERRTLDPAMHARDVERGVPQLGALIDIHAG